MPQVEREKIQDTVIIRTIARANPKSGDSTIAAAVEHSFHGGGAQVLVLKVLNGDLPIGEPPILEPK